MKRLPLARGLTSAALILLFCGAANAGSLIDFDNLVSGDIAANTYAGVVFTGASVLTEGSSLNPPYPPQSAPNVVYNYLNDTISLAFSVNGVTSVGAYVTGLASVTESIFDGTTLLGSISTGGPNYTGSGGTPNIFLNLSGSDITSATFSDGGGVLDTFTLDNVTIGGANVVSAVPLPSTWG